MRNVFITALFLIIAISFSMESYAQETPKPKEQKETAASEGIVNSICPVSGEEIDADKTYTYEGKTYAVCCNSCLKKFKADPEKYISRLSEDGKSLKKKNQ